MATNLYGLLLGDRAKKAVSRTGNKYIYASLATGKGRVDVELKADGTYEVFAGPCRVGPAPKVWSGNAHKE